MLSRFCSPAILSIATAALSTSYVIAGVHAMSTADEIDSSVGGSLASAFGFVSIIIGATAMGVFGIFAAVLYAAGRKPETGKTVRVLRSTFAVLATLVAIVLGLIGTFALNGMDKDTALAALGAIAPAVTAIGALITYAAFEGKRRNS